MSIEKLGPTVQTITRPTFEECRQWLYDQYGTDYEIRDHHTVTKGGWLFGWGQKHWVETKYVVGARRNAPVTAAAATTSSFERDRDELLRKAAASNVSTVQLAQMDKKVSDQFKMLASKIDSLATAAAAQANDKHPTIQKIEELLAENEFTLSYINRIASRIAEEFPYAQLDDFDTVQRAVVDWIGQAITIAPKAYRKLPHVIVLIGPTGVGKTTTIAKLASNIILEAKKKGKPRPRMRMITIDRTRVGALEQLRRYGEIMETGVDAAETTEDIRQIFDTYRDSMDAIFIDTSGYSPNDYENIGKMRALLDVPGLNPDVYLTVTASTKARDLVSIIQNYEPFAFQSVIVTKCDETSSYGNVLSVLSEKHKGIAYITDGQNAARNIERASTVYFLTRLHAFKIDRIHIEDTFTEEN